MSIPFLSHKTGSSRHSGNPVMDAARARIRGERAAAAAAPSGPAEVTVASLVHDHAAFDRCLSGALSKQDVPIQAMVRDNRDNGLGLAEYYNMALDEAACDFVLFAHPDVDFGPAAVGVLREALARGCGAAGGIGRAMDGSIVVASKVRGSPRLVSTLDACLLMVDRRHGIRFDRSFSGWHCVVEDYCLAVAERGLLTAVPSFSFLHEGVTTSAWQTRNAWGDDYHRWCLKLREKWSHVEHYSALGRHVPAPAPVPDPAAPR